MSKKPLSEVSSKYFNGSLPNSLRVSWSDISGNPALLVQFLVDNSTCGNNCGLSGFNNSCITKEGCYNLTGLYDEERVTGIYFLPLVPADASVPE